MNIEESIFRDLNESTYGKALLEHMLNGHEPDPLIFQGVKFPRPSIAIRKERAVDVSLFIHMGWTDTNQRDTDRFGTEVHVLSRPVKPHWKTLIHSLGSYTLDIRAQNALRAAGIVYVEELFDMTKKQLRLVPGLGGTSIQRIADLQLRHNRWNNHS